MIDCHVHIFPDPLFRAIWQWFDDHAWPIQEKLYAEEVAQRLAAAGTSRYVLLNYAHKAGMSADLNQWTHAFCQRHPEAIPFGAVHHEDQNKAEILTRCFEEYGFYGIKFHTHVAAVRPDDPRLFPIYETLIKHDKVITLHAGNGPSLHGYKETTKHVSGARFVRTVLTRYPELKLIIPHLGADEFDEFFALMAEFPNLWMDSTMAVSGHFPVTIPWDKIEQFSDRILYGSDFPNIPYELLTEVQVIKNSPLSRKAEQQILADNVRRLLTI